MKDVIKIKKPNQVSNVKVSHEASSFYADLSKQWAMKLDKPIENGEYSSKYYAKISEQYANSANKSAMSAEVAASNLEKFVINSLYFPELKISNEDTILNNLEREKRSTFDKSKFTVVGSLTITDEGVASGFGSSNDLLTTYIFNPSNTWKIKGSFITPTQLTNSQAICAVSNTTYSSRIEINSYNSNTEIRFGWHLSSNNASYMSQPVGSIVLQFNTQYFYEWSFDGTQYLLRVSTDNKNWQISAQYTSSENIYTNNSYIRIGKSSGSYQIFTGSIDLKQFSITVDGKEVFNGNKTGIDTIKADNYEVVGSPVISNDGVLSNCTYNADYVSSKQTFNLYNANTWEIQCHYNPMGLSNKSEYFMFYSPTINSNGLHLGYKTKSTLQLTVFEDGNKPILTNPNISLNWESYTDYLFKVRFTGTQYLLDYSKDNGNTWIKLLTVNSNKKTVSSPVYVRNGIYSSSGIDYGIKIGITDLNKTKVYIDGNLVYQPCLKIPYTQSKTGSKIVDGVYRDRVWDMNEQFGYTHYYTLGDTDFTLATCKGSDVVESGDNYEQTADLTLKQWGSATSGQTVNLLPYKDTNYAVTLANGSKTKSSFVANAAGDYFAVGKTVLG